MKYVIATLLAAAVLFLFAVFAVAVGWQHGGGYLVQAALWLIIAGLWGAVVKNWETIVARFRRTERTSEAPSILSDDVKFTILAGLIVIVGSGLFFALRSNPKPTGITALELVYRLRQREPTRLSQYSDEKILYDYMTVFPDKYIYNNSGRKWIGDDDWRERWRNR